MKEILCFVINEAMLLKTSPVQYLTSCFILVVRYSGSLCIRTARRTFIGCLQGYLNQLQTYGLPYFGSLVIGRSLHLNEPVRKKARCKPRCNHNTPIVTESQYYVSIPTKQFSTELFHVTHSITERTAKIRHQDTEETTMIW